MSVSQAYITLFTVVLIILGVLILFALIRAVKGPRATDRIVAINVIGTITNITIAILATWLSESYLADVCLIYAIVSFVAVIVLTKAYAGVYLDRKSSEKREEGGKFE